MANYRTAMGKMVDMSALASRNEKTRAVGNMKVNARGDTIDSQGRIIKPVTAKVNEQYAHTVGNRSSHVVRKPTQAQKSIPPKPKVNLNELTAEEREFEEDDGFSAEVEAIKAKEQGKK